MRYELLVLLSQHTKDATHQHKEVESISLRFGGFHKVL